MLGSGENHQNVSVEISQIYSKENRHNLTIQEKRPLPFFNNSPTLIYVNTSDKGGILNINSNDLEDILAHALATIKGKMGESYSIEKVNLAKLHRITGISRAKLRKLKKNGSYSHRYIPGRRRP